MSFTNSIELPHHARLLRSDIANRGGNSHLVLPLLLSNGVLLLLGQLLLNGRLSLLRLLLNSWRVLSGLLLRALRNGGGHGLRGGGAAAGGEQRMRD